MQTRNYARLSDAEIASLRNAIESETLTVLAGRANVHHTTLSRALRGETIQLRSASKLRALPPRVRTKAEFASDSASTTRAPRSNYATVSHASQSDALAWIRSARDQQLLGSFQEPVLLSTAMKTDDAIYTAFNTRVDPLSVLDCELHPHDSQRGRSVADTAAEYATAPREVLQGIVGTRVDHGLAIGIIRRTPNKSGTRVGFRLEEWPLEFVAWDENDQVLKTAVRDSVQVPIRHGDGTWVVFSRFDRKPWQREAAIIPGSFVYARHAEGMADWSGASKAHGSAKVLGELPEGVTVKDADGNLTPEADAFLSMLIDVVLGIAPAGVRAAGSKADFLANASTAWQIFSELATNGEKAATRIYLGTDAPLGSQGGAPGVDIATLFGVAETKLQGDCGCVESAMLTGFYAPWTALNYGDSRLTPRLKYLLPDPDSAKKHTENADAYDRLLAVIAGFREQRLELTQATVDVVAKQLGVRPAPRLVDMRGVVSSA